MFTAFLTISLHTTPNVCAHPAVRHQVTDTLKTRNLATKLYDIKTVRSSDLIVSCSATTKNDTKVHYYISPKSHKVLLVQY